MASFHALLATCSMLFLGSPALAKSDDRPNVLVIVADDLGFSDLGAFGGEIQTPNLDRLAYSGIRLSGFHTSPACSPSRAMLLTGSDNHRVGLGNMVETIQPNQKGRAGYETYLRHDAPTLAERLSSAGYRTLLSGKWHLGSQPDQDPHARGFQSSFAFVGGAVHNHFGIPFKAEDLTQTNYRENGVGVPSLPSDFYSSDYFATKMIQQLDAATEASSRRKPFFAYLAFTAPHSPMQAPQDIIDKYRGKYDAGYEALAAERLRRLKELGFVKPNVVPHRFVDVEHWDQLPAEDRSLSSRSMEIYAAMVDRLDKDVGRVIDALTRTGELKNTVIIFLSDNGPEGQFIGEVRKPENRARLARDPAAMAALGGPKTFISYGPGWAQAASAPSARFKTFATEGGTRNAAFITGPGVRKAGTISSAYLQITDIVPTVLELAGVKSEQGRFAGKAAQPIDGRSWMPLLKHDAAVYAADSAVGIELFGSRSVREGDWKITDVSDGKWRLFDIAADPGETRDLSAIDPARFKTLMEAWDAYAKSVGLIMPQPVGHPSPPKEIEY